MNALRNLPAEERVDLMGNAEALSKAGKLAAADALSLVERFHDDPERYVVQTAIGLALAWRSIDQCDIECIRHLLIKQKSGQPVATVVLILVQKIINH